eukprot:CAMPEP_0179093320 /NCGR_PEP_ID=MMETSP0796-20121207/42730_1 /TAXON_ID=73915 /ORGANISM="Pyrodinium bahamense, Strain pbaha01" /LENGTH=124 /DNA_ID=CAMNT_0020790949 /DNA_START=451 /DNA_END=825 /DNA_ORIENTATION=+
MTQLTQIHVPSTYAHGHTLARLSHLHTTHDHQLLLWRFHLRQLLRDHRGTCGIAKRRAALQREAPILEAHPEPHADPLRRSLWGQLHMRLHRHQVRDHLPEVHGDRAACEPLWAKGVQHHWCEL